MRRLLLAITLAMAAAAAGAQGQRVEFYSGLDLSYRDIYFNGRIYDVLLQLAPGVKWRPGNHWQVAAQGLIPLVNQYGKAYRLPRLGMLVGSKELYAGRHAVKLSGGLFGGERYGLDAKWMWAARPWLALEGEAGLTGLCTMAGGWACSKMRRVTAQAAARFYIPRYNVDIRLSGGRYIYEDWGGQIDAMRHFNHCTIGLYAQRSTVISSNAGFKVVAMLPPYKRRGGKTVTVRPASNFRTTYNFRAESRALRTYATDPEENEREGHFDRARMQWGSNTMTPDFTLCDKH